MRVAVILFLLLPCFALQCDRFMCAPSSVSLSPDTCIYYDNSLPQGPAYILQECTDSLFSYCPPLQAENNSTCQVPPQSPAILPDTELSVPGEPCEFDFDCYGETICEDYKCWNPSTSCTTDESCNPGTFCNATTCQPQVSSGDECTYDNMCGNGYGCNSGLCTAYMSVQAMQSVSTCNNNYSLLCEFQMCFDYQGNSVCAWNVTSSVSTPMNCTSNDNCTSSTQNNANFTGICSCSMGTTGKAYCSVFPGDFPSSLLLESMKKWVSGSEINNCNTARRTSPSCMQTYMTEEESLTYFYYYFFTVNYPAIQDMDQCGATIYVQSYYTALEAYNDYFSQNKTEPSWGQKLTLAGLALTAVVGI